jgi:hypothetical protein
MVIAVGGWNRSARALNVHFLSGCAAVDGNALLQVRKTLGGSHHTTSASTKAAAEAKKGVFSSMFASMVGAEPFTEPFHVNPELAPISNACRHVFCVNAHRPLSRTLVDCHFKPSQPCFEFGTLTAPSLSTLGR